MVPFLQKAKGLIMINFQNLPNRTVVECRSDIQTSQGTITKGTRGIIVDSTHVLPNTLYRIQWPHPEPLDLPDICTGAGGDLDDHRFTQTAHDDDRVGLVGRV